MSAAARTTRVSTCGGCGARTSVSVVSSAQVSPGKRLRASSGVRLLETGIQTASMYGAIACAASAVATESERYDADRAIGSRRAQCSGNGSNLIDGNIRGESVSRAEPDSRKTRCAICLGLSAVRTVRLQPHASASAHERLADLGRCVWGNDERESAHRCRGHDNRLGAAAIERERDACRARRIGRRRRWPRGEEQAGSEPTTSRVKRSPATEPAGPSARRAYNVLLLPMDSSSALAPTSLAAR